MAMRWKKDPPETGLRRIGAGPRCSFYHNGDGEWVLRTGRIGGDWRGPVTGWFWYGMGQNTATQPVATEDEAKAQAVRFYKSNAPAVLVST